jgi:hypothetical protein
LKRADQYFHTCREDGIRTKLGQIPARIQTDIKTAPEILRTSLMGESGVGRLDDGNFEWYPSSQDWNQFITCQQWDTIHERYQGRFDTGDTLLMLGAASGEGLPPAATNL